MKINVNKLNLNINGKQILDNVSFGIEENTFTCILGHNGSGKSSILRAIVGEIKTYLGDIKIPIKETAYLPQEIETPPFITVYDIISLGFYNRKIPTAKKNQIIDSLIKDCGISHVKQLSFEEISAGEKQRTWIAFILAQSKNIMLLDEPFSSIDINSRTDFYKLFKKIVKLGKTVIIVTHDVKMIREFCDRVILIENGKKIFEGNPAKGVSLIKKD